MLDTQSKHSIENTYQKTTLYRYVFEAKLIKLAVLLLYGFFILQPVGQAYAFIEEVVTDGPSEVLQPTVIDTPIISNTKQDTQSEQVVDSTKVTSEVPLEATTTSVTSEVVETTSVGQSQPTTATVSQVTVATSNPVATLISEESIRSSTSAILGVATTTTTSLSDNATSTGETLPMVTTVATTSIPVLAIITTSTAPTSTVVSVSTSTPVVTATTTATGTIEVGTHTSNAFNFDTKDCAVVGGGAYYCSSAKENTDVMKDGVFAAPDIDGDLEIYVRLDGVQQAITSNTIDDSAPYYDALSERIVWHRMVNDRYQIVSYDTKTQKETLFTNTNYNNMEPVAYGTITLWQAWIDTNWEIMMFDGVITLQLTHNQMQDVSPHMRGGYIVWQSQFTLGWQVAVYNQKTNSIEYIPSEEGVKVENPRFVLVYDSTNKEGDIQTVGYDFDNKTTFNLGNIPAQLPDKLPNPDQTGETRALIQVKQTQKEGESEILDIPQTVSSTPNGVFATSSVTNASSTTTLDLSQGATSSSVATTSLQTVSVEMQDIIVPQYSAASAVVQVATSTIPDIVIPPLSSTSTLEIR